MGVFQSPNTGKYHTFTYYASILVIKYAPELAMTIDFLIDYSTTAPLFPFTLHVVFYGKDCASRMWSLGSFSSRWLPASLSKDVHKCNTTTILSGKVHIYKYLGGLKGIFLKLSWPASM